MLYWLGKKVCSPVGFSFFTDLKSASEARDDGASEHLTVTSEETQHCYLLILVAVSHVQMGFFSFKHLVDPLQTCFQAPFAGGFMLLHQFNRSRDTHLIPSAGKCENHQN